MADFLAAIDHLDATIKRRNQAQSDPGLAIGLTDREQLIFTGAYGLANRDKKLPVTPDTLFEIGSISKAFCSIVLLQLQEQGLLSIYDPVTRFLPWFQVQSNFNPITLRHLMSHTSGIIMGMDETVSAVTEVWNLRNTTVNVAPGKIFHYSNTGYKALGLVLEAFLGQHISTILSERIFGPLGMTASVPVITSDLRHKLAVGYDPYFDDRPYPRGGALVPATWLESDCADGSISSTAADMCCYLRALLNHGEGLISHDSFNQLIEPIIPTGDDLHGEHYGLGLCIRHSSGNQVLSHSGGMVGYYADVIADLDAGLGVVVLTNGPGEPEKISQYVHKLFCSALDGDKKFPDFVEEPEALPPGDYVGRYRSNGREFTLTSNGGYLILDLDGEKVKLEPRGGDDYLAHHPSFDLFLLRFIRKSISHLYQENDQKEHPKDEATPVLGAVYGGEVFNREGYTLPQVKENLSEWEAFPGHYRSHNPWYTNFRVVLRDGKLVLIEPFDSEELLIPITSKRFWVGTNPLLPEFVEFEIIIDGKSQQVNRSGGVYSRTFTH